MLYRKFGTTDLLVSEIGFGAWAIGGGTMIGDIAIGWGDTDDGVSTDAIYAALDAGINFFDTADIYGLGHSEELLGKTIGQRKDVIIATKGGNVAREEKFTVDYSKNYILKACEDSLRRLKRNTIDYYQLHTARMPHLQQGDCVEAMQQLQQEGKIRYWGLSLNTFNPSAEAKFLIENNWGNGVQLVLNLLNQKSLPLLKLAGEKKYGIIVRMPLQFGLLTGKFNSEVSFRENDHRKKRLTTEIINSSNDSLVKIWELCKKYNCTKTQLALSYILCYEEITTIIPGIRTAAHAVENTSGLFRLSSEDMKMIELAGTTYLLPVIELIEKQG